MLTAKNSRPLLFAAATIVVLTSFFFFFRSSPFLPAIPGNDEILSGDDKSSSHFGSKPAPPKSTGLSSSLGGLWPPSKPSFSSGPKYAFATFLSTRLTNESEPDPYFTATRVLAYQLLHQPQTKSRKGTPFVVIVPPHVSQAKRDVLKEEGATVIPVDLLQPTNWTAHPGETRWIDQFAKLRLFSLTQYDRIVYMDNDMLVTRPIDDIWTEEMVANPQKTDLEKFNSNEEGGSEGSSRLPAEYVLAGVTDNSGPGSERPTPVTDSSMLNGGFFALKPNLDQFNYYVSVLENPKPLFAENYMEMGLLNYAHRRDGPMPWIPLPSGKYCNNWPELVDLRSGSATLHDKFWSPGNKDWIDRELVEMWWRVQGQMEGFWQRKDEGRKRARSLGRRWLGI